MGGTRAVAEALAKLAGELGATLKPSTEITGLDMENGAVRGVKRADGGIEPFDCVVLQHGFDPHLSRARRAAMSGRATTARASNQPVRAWCSISA